MGGRDGGEGRQSRLTHTHPQRARKAGSITHVTVAQQRFLGTQLGLRQKVLLLKFERVLPCILGDSALSPFHNRLRDGVPLSTELPKGGEREKEVRRRVFFPREPRVE